MFPLIKLDGICKFYGNGEGNVNALCDVSLEVNKGDMLAVLGNSGSGKSTLMNIIGCLDLPSNGKYLLDGKNVAKMSDRQHSFVRGKTIGFIFQSFYLIPEFSAYQNVELPLIYNKTPKKNREEICKAALEKVGLTDRMHHKPNQLSGGQKQRVAIARAISLSPSLILADEPTGNLDPTSAKDVLNTLLRLNDDGVTIIMITHDKLLAKLAKKKIEIKNGIIV